MRMLKTTVRLMLFLSLVFLIGCSKGVASKPPFIHRNTVFYASAGNHTATFRVESSFSMDDERQMQEYQGGILLQQGAIKIRHEFVGTTFCPVSADGKGWNYADVYILVITGEKTQPETILVVYRGGQKTVVDSPDLQVTMDQGHSEPAPAAELAALGG